MEARGKIFFTVIVSVNVGIIASYSFLLEEITLHVFDTMHSSSEIIHSYTLAIKHPSFHSIFHMNSLGDSIPHFLNNAIIR